ncbi:patatin-like phospholipase family protein [Streptomyces sp. NPDC054783]
MARTAVELSAGGSLGAIQVGMLPAAADHDVDLLVGTSVGAVNGARLAGHPGRRGAEAPADLWRAVRRDDIFPVQPIRELLALTGRGSRLVAADPFRWLLEQPAGVGRLKGAACQLCLTAAEVTTGRQAVLSRGPVVDAGMAGAAAPGVFPPVRFAQRDLIDGAAANRTPISDAVEAGAQTVYVLHAGYACAPATGPGSALGMDVHALTLILQQCLLVDVAAYGSPVADAGGTAAVPAGHLPGRFPPQPRTRHRRPGEHPQLARRRSAQRSAVPADARASMIGCGLRGQPTSG